MGTPQLLDQSRESICTTLVRCSESSLLSLFIDHNLFRNVLASGLNKPRGHSLLVADRPNFVTILALVRDATARLPNGEGTRADICQLLKDSQYIRDQGDADGGHDKEGYLHSVVSGALDRLHYEADPCVRYYPRRKEWLYLHRARSESEFGN